jgi:hypothetical protein
VNPLPDNPTVLDRILHAVTLACSTVVDPDAANLEPNGDSDIFPALDVFDDGDTLILEGSSTTERMLAVRIEGFSENEDGTEATAERNALHASLIRAVMADETLGGLVESISPGDRRTGAAILAERRRLMFGQDFAIKYAIDRYDPALPA